jgi:hypothetical protein
MDFYLFASNKDSGEPYPHNKAGNFIISLPHGLDLQGEWEVSLSEIILNRPVQNDTDTRHIFVCSPMVNHSVVGKHEYPVLRRVPLKKQGRQIDIFSAEQFYPINSFRLSYLHIYFLNDQYKLQEFEQADVTDILLHFRKKPLRICSS